MHDKRNVGDPSPVPVFVIGMPRSGTTLVEQILASHPEVFGAGELDKISNGVAELGSENVSVCYPEMMSLMTNVQLRRLFGVEATLRDAAVEVAGEGALRIAPYLIERVGVVSTLLPGLSPKVIDRNSSCNGGTAGAGRRRHHCRAARAA